MEPNQEPYEARPATETEPPRKRSAMSGRAVLWVILAVVLAFIAGFGWQYMRASNIQSQLETTERELRVERLRVQLARAALEAQAGEFEPARREMSELFDSVQTDREQLPLQVRHVIDEMLAARDEIITGLSRGNPETAGTLFGMLDRLREAVEMTPAPTPEAPPPG